MRKEELITDPKYIAMEDMELSSPAPNELAKIKVTGHSLQLSIEQMDEEGGRIVREHISRVFGEVFTWQDVSNRVWG
jgi:hypothetical protein